VLSLIVNVPEESDRTAPPLNGLSEKIVLLPVVRPFFSVNPVNVTSPFVPVMSKIREFC
jgi:hypothetical protein